MQPQKSNPSAAISGCTTLRGKLALVTGATAGIGRATAEALAARGCDLILVGRRADRLRELAAGFAQTHGIKTTGLPLDISDRESVAAKLNTIDLSRLSILINNAGLARGTDKLQDAQLDDLDAMVDTNVKGLLYITRLALPHLIRSGSSHVVNIGSVAGRYTYPGGAVYCATKFAVRALNEGLRMDLMGTSVRVTNIEPGMVETEFSEVRLQDKDKAKKIYEGFQPLVPADLADTILWCLERPAHVNIQELMIFPTAQAGVGPGFLTKHTREI